MRLVAEAVKARCRPWRSRLSPATMTVAPFLRNTWARLRRPCPVSLGVAALSALGLTVLSGLSAMPGAIRLGLSGLIAVFAMTALLRVELTGRGAHPGGEAYWRDAARLAASALLVTLVLGFLAIMTLLAVTLAAMAVMAGAGFDFEAVGGAPEQSEAAMASFRATPAWRIVQGVFYTGLFVWLVGVARCLPFAGASVRESRIVALEAFTRSRGRGLAFLVGAGLVLVLPIALVVLSGICPTGLAQGVARTVSGAILLWTASTVLSASAELTSRGG